MSQQRVPVVTLVFIVANIVAAFTLLVNPDVALDFGFRTNHPSLQSAFISLFLHANVLHLLGNMIFLAAVGAAVELSTGSLRFASVYLASGLLGVGCHYVATLNYANPAPVIGASGCVAGCVAYYCARYRGLRVPIAPKLSLSVATITIVWILLQLIGAVVHIGDAASPVSFWAHLGGFAGGLLLAILYKSPDLRQLKLKHEVLADMNFRGPAASLVAAKRHLEQHPNDPVALHQLARAYSQMDDHPHEAQIILRLMDIEPEAEQAALLNRLVDIGEASIYPSSKRTFFAERFKGAYPNLARTLLMTILDSGQDPYRPEAMLALVAMEIDAAPSKAKELLEDLVSQYPLHPCAELARKRGWIQ